MSRQLRTCMSELDDWAMTSKRSISERQVDRSIASLNPKFEAGRPGICESLFNESPNGLMRSDHSSDLEANHSIITAVDTSGRHDHLAWGGVPNRKLGLSEPRDGQRRCGEILDQGLNAASRCLGRGSLSNSGVELPLRLVPSGLCLLLCFVRSMRLPPGEPRAAHRQHRQSDLHPVCESHGPTLRAQRARGQRLSRAHPHSHQSCSCVKSRKANE